MPLDYSQMIPETEPVRLLDAVLEELDYTALLRLYSTKGRKSAVPPKILFKIIVFAMLEGVYSLRAIRRQCLVNIHYMWLLQGYKAPSHMCIGRFYERITLPVLKDLFAQFIHLLSELITHPGQPDLTFAKHSSSPVNPCLNCQNSQILFYGNGRIT